MFSSVQLKRVATMTPGGRKKTVSALVVVGNKKGAVGECLVILLQLRDLNAVNTCMGFVLPLERANSLSLLCQSVCLSTTCTPS